MSDIGELRELREKKLPRASPPSLPFPPLSKSACEKFGLFSKTETRGTRERLLVKKVFKADSLSEAVGTSPVKGHL